MLLKYTGTISVEFNSFTAYYELTSEVMYIHQLYRIDDRLVKRFYKTTFKRGDTVYMRFIPDADFDASADGGFYVAVRRSNSSYEVLDLLLPPDDNNQINRVNHICSFSVDTDNLIFVITSINTDQWSNSTQDRVTMQISIDHNFNSYAEFKIRYDED